jgi:hypothetical protein
MGKPLLMSSPKERGYTMTRKDYQLIAGVLKDSQVRNQTATLALTVRLADALALENPRFDRARFLTACGVN